MLTMGLDVGPHSLPDMPDHMRTLHAHACVLIMGLDTSYYTAFVMCLTSWQAARPCEHLHMTPGQDPTC